ncbi:MAG: right-handed parallel beta-helix repeat-containing protein, partial [Actinobacteria bacterium]
MDRREFLRMGAAFTAVAVTRPVRRVLPRSLVTSDAVAVPVTGTASVAQPAQPAIAAADSPGGWFDVKSFGAVGDGLVDDTAALAAAVDAAKAAGGGVVWFPAGTYVSSTIVLSGGVTLRGVGWQSIIRLRSGANAHLITTPEDRVNYYGVVRDLCLDGNRENNRTGDGLHLYAATYCRIESVKISRFAGHGIAFRGSGAHQTIAPWVEGCGIYECGGNGVDVDHCTADCKLHALDIGLCDKGVILPNAGFLSDVTIWQCQTGLYGYWTVNAHLHLVRAERSRFNGFLFEGCRDIAVQECRAYENNQGGGENHGFALRGTVDHRCERISFVGRIRQAGHAAHEAD